MKTRHEILMEDPEYRRLYAIEGLVTDTAELVAQLMEERGVSKAELARRLGKSRAWVTQLLSGRANMTIRTIAEVTYALGSEVRLSTRSQASQQVEVARFRSWETTFETPCGANIRRATTEPRFVFDDLDRQARASWDQADITERPEFAA